MTEAPQQGKLYTGPAPPCPICNRRARPFGTRKGRRRWKCRDHGTFFESYLRIRADRPPSCPCGGPRVWAGWYRDKAHGVEMPRALCRCCGRNLVVRERLRLPELSLFGKDASA